jgi:hypothetical protein
VPIAQVAEQGGEEHVAEIRTEHFLINERICYHFFQHKF